MVLKRPSPAQQHVQQPPVVRTSNSTLSSPARDRDASDATTAPRVTRRRERRCCCAGEGLFNTKLTGPGEVFLQSYSHGKFKNYAIEWYLGNRASAGLARFASRGGAAADPFGAPPAADTEVIQRRGNNAPAPVPAAAPMDRKGR